MELTSDIVDRYKGGQMEIQNQGEGYLYRGEIEDIYVSGENLTVKFAWRAKAKGFPVLVEGWVNDDEDLGYTANLTLYAATINNDRLILSSPIIGEMVAIFPPGGSRIDPARVEGLRPAAS
jgi:hypothetical protein